MTSVTSSGVTSLAAHDLRLVVKVVLLLGGALGRAAFGPLLLLAGRVEEDDAGDEADDEADPAQHETGAVEANRARGLKWSGGRGWVSTSYA